MRRIYFLEPSLFAASELLQHLKQQNQQPQQVAVLADQQWKADVLGADSADQELTSDIRNAQSRAAMTGTGVGLATGLSATLIPGIGVGLATAGLMGALMGGSFGLVMGTLIGTAEEHPLFTKYKDRINAGSVLVVMDVDDDAFESTLESIRQLQPELAIEERDLVGVSEPAS
ncbi:MAG: hypothetical protein Tsb002_00640 [Wenzhouxiangellaceae bacterium]